MQNGKGLDRDHVRRLADLAKLDLGDRELQTLTADLASILEHFAALDALDLRHIEPMAHPLGITARTETDAPRPGLPAEAALREAARTEGGHFAVPRVVELTMKTPNGNGGGRDGRGAGDGQNDGDSHNGRDGRGAGDAP